MPFERSRLIFDLSIDKKKLIIIIAHEMFFFPGNNIEKYFRIPFPKNKK